MTKVKSHGRIYGGSPRPQWAGPVQAVSREHSGGQNQVTRSAELSGVVLPISVPSAGSHTFGQSLGFPHLGEALPDMPPETWKSWSRFEQVVSEAAAGLMGWQGPQPHHRAAQMSTPDQALHLRLVGRTVHSTSQGEEPSLRAHGISGEVSRVFNIRDVSGRQQRYESAGSSASFQVTSGGVHWSKDPRSL